jgi:hypothetical protein
MRQQPLRPGLRAQVQVPHFPLQFRDKDRWDLLRLGRKRLSNNRLERPGSTPAAQPDRGHKNRCLISGYILAIL